MTEPKHQFKLEIFWPYSEPLNPLDDDADAYIYLSDGRIFVVSFFTPSRVLASMEKDRIDGKNANGAYFWATDCLIVREISQETCELAVDDLLESGSFFNAFSDVTENMKDMDK